MNSAPIQFTTALIAHVADAYEHLYDLVYLRTCVLARMLLPSTSSRKQGAWDLHHRLLAAIEELNPGPQAPLQSREFRRYQLMVLHYVDGLDPQPIADQLAISRRHYYREHAIALETIAQALADSGLAVNEAPQGDQDPEVTQVELLRREAARLAQADRTAPLAQIIQGAIGIVIELAESKGTRLQMSPSSPPSQTQVDASILRQILIGLLNDLLEQGVYREIHVKTSQRTAHVTITVQGVGRIGLPTHVEKEESIYLASVDELANLQSLHIQRLVEQGVVAGFELDLPATTQHVVLVVDDNADALELFQRYLSKDYQVITSSSGTEAIRLARETRPYAITLDLMMAHQDGWDVLQTLMNQPETHSIPIVVCSVLNAKDLALSLGAYAFLAKPVDDQVLLAVLRDLERA
jgi:CheY-like chemotaxis protein